MFEDNPVVYHLIVNAPKKTYRLLAQCEKLQEVLREKVNQALVDADLKGHVIVPYVSRSCKHVGCQKLSRVDGGRYMPKIASIVYATANDVLKTHIP